MNIISEKAHKKLVQMGANKNNFLRIIVKSGGCAGMTYDAELDKVMREKEEVISVENGITIVTNPESREFLDGLHIDYSDDLITAGFRFNNRSNESSCGCGASFAIAGFPTLNKEGAPCGS